MAKSIGIRHRENIPAYLWNRLPLLHNSEYREIYQKFQIPDNLPDLTQCVPVLAYLKKKKTKKQISASTGISSN